MDDEASLREPLADYLSRQGFAVRQAADAAKARSALLEDIPDLVLLDIMMPGEDGISLCRHLVESRNLPVIFLTAKGEATDRIVGLEIGADDYVVKPFSPRELVARVKAIIRRTHPEAIRPKAVLSLHGLVLDQEKHRVTVQNVAVSLTPLEFKLLQALMTSPGRVLSRDELLQFLYPGGEAVIDRVIDVHIGKLRQKIEPDPSTPFFILTVRGIGYRFADRDAQQVRQVQT